MNNSRNQKVSLNRVTPADARGFLPMSRAEMEARGWDRLDILIITGDAYVDHPSFGAMINDLQRLFDENQRDGTINFDYETEVSYGPL